MTIAHYCHTHIGLLLTPSSALQTKGWASGVSASTRTEAGDFSIFDISVALTPQGFEHWQDVQKMIYAHIAFLESAGLQVRAGVVLHAIVL